MNVDVKWPTKRLDTSDPQAGPAAEPLQGFTLRVLLVAAVAALALTITFITRREFWLDEYYTALISNMAPGDMTRYVLGDPHPPLYYFVIGVWRRIFGDSVLALRSFSTLAHLLGGGVFFLLVRTILHNDRLALVGAVLFLLSPGLIFYAAEARMYSLTVLLVTTATLLAWRQMSAEGGTREAVALGVMCALAFYTHYLTLFASVALFALMGAVLLIRRNGSWKPFLASASTSSLLILPWAPVVYRQMAGKRELNADLHASWIDPSALTFLPDGAPQLGFPNLLPEIASNAASLLGVYPAASTPVLLLLAVPFLVVLGFAALRTLRGDTTGVFVMLVCLAQLAGCLAVGVLNRRYLLWLAPLALIFLCMGLLEAWRRHAPVVAAVLAVALILLTAAGAVRVANSTDFERIGPIVELIANRYQPGDLVVFSALYAQVPFDYHAQRAGIDPDRRGFPETVYAWWERQDVKGWGSPVIEQADLVAFLNGIDAESRERVWLVQFEHDHYDPHGQLLRGFESRGWSISPCPADRLGASAYELYLVARTGAESGCTSGVPLADRNLE
jgi:4-amino-4-deoxy-L-arabinose transferase-like glycosyltransferase